MKYTVLGGFNTSKLGMGCYALGGTYGRINVWEYENTLKRAIELGINYFDTADTYGAIAEEVLGKILAPYRNNVCIATKVGIKNSMKPDLSRKAIISACENSLKRLGTDYIDVYNLHFDDHSIRIEEPLETLEELKRRGMIKSYGIGHFSVERASVYCEKGNIDCIMMELSPVATESIETLLPIARNHKAAGIAFSVTGMGIMSGRISYSTIFDRDDIRRIAPVFHGNRFKIALEIQKEFQKIASSYCISAIQLSIAWVLRVNGINIALTGPSKVPHIEENCKAVDLEIKEQDIRELDAFLEKQNDKLREMQITEILEILKREAVGTATVSELAYVMEAFASEKIIEEEILIPIFKKLLAADKKEPEVKNRELIEIREKLRMYIKQY